MAEQLGTSVRNQALAVPTCLAVHAHPDDETIATGGVLARYAAEGVRTVVVTCTGGEAGEISEMHLATPDNLGRVRADELAAALRVLRVAQSVKLGYRDSGMAGTPENQHPNAFVQADLDEATERLVQVMRTERPQVVVTYAENGGYGHPDHVRTHQVTVAAFHAAGDPTRYPAAGPAWQPAKLYYVLFPRSQAERFARTFTELGIEAPLSAPAGANAGSAASSFGDDDDRVTTVVNVSAFAEAKRRAMTMHRTQFGPDHFLARLPAAVLRDLWSHEHFLLAEGPSNAGDSGVESDLFAGIPAD
jgi:N-acetyl-1-D-myo-inositol-2-amino-2-deoxy-alpha-D-glucopyranoside deacetylase